MTTDACSISSLPSYTPFLSRRVNAPVHVGGKRITLVVPLSVLFIVVCWLFSGPNNARRSGGGGRWSAPSPVEARRLLFLTSATSRYFFLRRRPPSPCRPLVFTLAAARAFKIGTTHPTPFMSPLGETGRWKVGTAPRSCPSTGTAYTRIDALVSQTGTILSDVASEYVVQSHSQARGRIDRDESSDVIMTSV